MASHFQPNNRRRAKTHAFAPDGEQEWQVGAETEACQGAKASNTVSLLTFAYANEPSW